MCPLGVIVVSLNPPLRWAVATTATGPWCLPFDAWITAPGRSRSIASSTGSSRPRSPCGALDGAPVLVDVAVRAGRLVEQLGEPLALTLQPALEPHDVAVGLELGERQRQELAGRDGVVGAHQVGRHVVGRPERRAQVERAAERQLGHLVERDERAPQHDGRAELVDAAPAGATGELRVLAGRQGLVVVAGELRELLDHHAARRHVDADGERLGGEHDLHEPLDEAGLDDLLERRHHPGVVWRDAGLELGHELLVAEHLEVGVASSPSSRPSAISWIAGSLVLVGEAHPGGDARRGPPPRTGLRLKMK